MHVVQLHMKGQEEDSSQKKERFERKKLADSSGFILFATHQYLLNAAKRRLKINKIIAINFYDFYWAYKGL